MFIRFFLAPRIERLTLFPEEMAKEKSVKRGKIQTNLLIVILKGDILTVEIVLFTTSIGPPLTLEVC